MVSGNFRVLEICFGKRAQTLDYALATVHILYVCVYSDYTP